MKEETKEGLCTKAANAIFKAKASKKSKDKDKK